MPFEQPKWMPDDDKAPSVEREAAVSRFWKENGIFAKSLRLREGAPQYVFYEGPPTANGRPHPGHVLTRVMKDLFPRYHTMTGKLVPRKAGWDTHGLPVEIEVEKELGLGSKEDIEKYGVEPFVKKCMESVFRYTQDWEDLTDRIGFWIDLSDAYVTYTREYVESVWWAVSQLWKKGLLYKGHKIVPWCTRCGTALSSHEVGWGYKTVDDPSITVKFRVTKMPDGSVPKEPTYLLAWTTTPWTLLSNVALAVKPDGEYVRVKYTRSPYRDHKAPDLEAGANYWVEGNSVYCALSPGPSWVQSSKWKKVDVERIPHQEMGAKATVLEKRSGNELAGTEYEPLFPPPDSMMQGKKAHYVVTGDFVTLDDGTGIVHIAPAFGADDYRVGRQYDLPFVKMVDAQGKVLGSGPWAGRQAKPARQPGKDPHEAGADNTIIANLEGRNLLVWRRLLKHDYPHCWRCETPLLYYPRAGWFIRTTEFRDRMLELNRTINWYPDHIREGRFGNFLRDNIDWALSRERYWGTPLNIWQCESCGHTESVESYDEVAGKDDVQGLDRFDEARRADPDLSEDLRVHKPYIDSVKYACPKCSSCMARVPEVIDCWFDSGAMPFAQWGWPGGGEEADRKFRAAHPADFISEAIDQTRGWFYSLLAISTMLFDKAPYENCVVLGLVCDEKGAKMSKSKGNYVEPKAILDTQGADALRWYFLSANQPWTSVRFSERNVSMANKDFLIKLRNVYSFFRIYAKIDGFDPSAGGKPVTDARPSKWGERNGRRRAERRMLLDRWILGELAATIRAVRESMDAYDSFGASQALSTFVESLSNWYLRRSRDRFWGSGLTESKYDAYWTLYEALVTTSLLIAPFTPFAAEEFYQVLVRSAFPDSAPESVHLCDYPDPDEYPTDQELSRGMMLAREVATLGRAARAHAKVKVRVPLSEATVVPSDTRDSGLLNDLAGAWLDELNVKQSRVWPTDPPFVRFEVKPNFVVLGPRLGAKVKKLAEALRAADGRDVRRSLRDTGKFVLDLEGERLELSPSDLDIRVAAEPGYSAAAGKNVLVVLDTKVTEALSREGIAREIVNRIQTMRKLFDLPYETRIETYLAGPDSIMAAVREHKDYICKETLSVRLLDAPPKTPIRDVVETTHVEGEDVKIAIGKAEA